MLAEVYAPVFEDSPRYLEKVQKACLDSCMKGFDKKLNKFIETNELDKKLKELEEIAEDPVPGVEKAW
jgi:vacuolar-type H+-ATPase subunit D/Vma8